MTKQELAKRIKQVAELSGSFVLRSGEYSDRYFDKYLFESEPVILSSIGEHLKELVPENIDILCGLELGGIPIVTILSQAVSLPAAFIRKAPKKYGTCKYAEGPDLPGKSLLLVEDVVSSGGAIIDAVRMMRVDGCKVEQAVCVIDRRKPKDSRLADEGIELKALFTSSDLEFV